MAETTAMRKRQKIESSNKTMFLWVTGMSVIVGFCLVIAWFLVQQMFFQGKIIAERADTVSTLEKNNAAVDDLRDNVRVLKTDANLLATPKADNDEKPLQIILDALPADANSLALGASLQEKIIGEADGITLESLEVKPTAAEEISLDGESSDASSDSDNSLVSENGMPFRVVVSSDGVKPLRDLLDRFEKSIRVIDVIGLQLDRSESEFTLTIDGQAYYEPAQTVELHKETVKP